MKESLSAIYRCLQCAQSRWEIVAVEKDSREIRRGELRCRNCRRVYPVRDGILNALPEQLPEEVRHEKEHAESLGYVVTETGEKHAINRENIRRFKHLFLSLPEGDGSHYFLPGGSFDNQAGNAERFYKTLDLLRLSGRERVLEVGASFGWSSWRFAQRGCEVVALDVTNYLQTADLYFEKDGSYFERVTADMSDLPFEDSSFDIIFSHSVIHHCKDLKKLFREFLRVLKPGGRVVALHECAFGVFEDKAGAALQEAIHEGFNENAYTIPEWKRGAKEGGFKNVRIHYFSFVDGYLNRKRIRKAKPTLKLSLARWVQSRPLLHRCLNALSIGPRILLRPKDWILIASKDPA
ncbi:MAG: methyltransferase domain-containing protein [Candidatus Omnitrophica bacterium]|nr:methyltransferase domain-containing protein [Candidatus Omnitrophota bacterium]